MHNLQVSIVRVGPEQPNLLEGLQEVFSEVFDDRKSHSAPQPERLANNHILCLAGLVGGKVVGGLTAYELPALGKAKNDIYLYDLAVLPEFRRQGIARALIEELLKQARERGVDSVWVQADTDEDDAPAIALYSTFVKSSNVLNFDLPLDGKRR